MVVVFLQYFIFIQLHFVWWLSFYSILYSLSFILYGGCLFTVFHIHSASFCMVVVFLQYMYFIFIELHFVWWLSFYSILYSLSFILYGGCLFTVFHIHSASFCMVVVFLHVFHIHSASFCMVVVFLQYFIFIQLHFVWWLSFYSILYSLSFILYGGCLFTVFYIHSASFCMVVVFLQYFIFIELHFVWWLSFYSILYSLSFILYGGCLFTVFYIH